MTLCDFRLRAHSHVVHPGRTLTCFTGSAAFRLEGRHPEKVIKSFNAAADYAFFCGTGIGISRGMGMTRRVLSRAQET